MENLGEFFLNRRDLPLHGWLASLVKDYCLTAAKPV
jgi:hypothetical protein